MWLFRSLFTAIAVLIFAVHSDCPVQGQEKYDPRIAGPSREAELALQGFRLPEGVKGTVAAAEPLLANPVAFTISSDGHLYVCETFRQEVGVEDNRSHMDWLEQDLQLESVEERLAMFRRFRGAEIGAWGVHHDRVRMLRDTDGDGTYDQDTVFADGFNDLMDGTGAGVIEYNGKVYYTCIPKLWMLEDKNNDGIAEEKSALHHGYGVRVAFRGHDLHGLTVGPDGRIYFSLGDRGYNVVTREGARLKRPDTGAVFRCDADGSNLEVFAYGLRNPQELAFDDAGNLFTGDNNSDSGDQARWVYVVQDGDTGWRMYYQYLDDRGPWNRERIWLPYRADEQTTEVQPASTLPPIINLGDGPSGLTYYPGTGLPDRYAGHFFLADFRGTAGNSGIRSFAMKPRGATFELTDSHEWVWSILATDVDFAPDGSVLISDWVNGWVGEGKGRVYRFVHEPSVASAAGVASLLGGGIRSLGHQELFEMLGHADRRVRQEAQFELVRRNAESDLLSFIESTSVAVARRHAIWGLWQTGLHSSNDAQRITASLSGIVQELKGEEQVQAIRVISDLISRYGARVVSDNEVRERIKATVLTTVTSEDLRLAGFSTVLVGQTGSGVDAAVLLSLLDRANNADPVLRHQASMGLMKLGQRQPGLLGALVSHPGAAGRLGLVLAMRRLQDPALTVFLKDADHQIMTEAARAIHDEDLAFGEKALADCLGLPGMSDAMLRRVLNAAYRLGTQEYAKQIAAIAGSGEYSESIRKVAVNMLATWNNPSKTDTVTGKWRPVAVREVEGLNDAVYSSLPGMLAGPEPIREAAVGLAADLGIRDLVPELIVLYKNDKSPAALRAAAFEALARLSNDKDSLIAEGLKDSDDRVRLTALDLLVRSTPDRAIPALKDQLMTGTIAGRQKAVRLLATIATDESEDLLLNEFESLKSGTLPAAVHLDLLDAAEVRGTSSLRQAVSQFRKQQEEQGSTLAKWSECLEGGDAARGREIFFGRSAASCRRCHKINSSGGEVGPDLSRSGLEKDRNYLLEAIVDPNAKIAKGFETLVIVTVEGQIHSGILKREDDQIVQLMSPQGALISIAKADIEERASGLSGMPVDINKNISRSDIRDLVEFLKTVTPVDSSHGKASPAAK